jgi:HEPN domain-containing protein
MPEDDAAGLAREWLRYAEYDLAAARTLSTGPPHQPHLVAFHAQQAAEKAIKALLVRGQREFPFVHDLDELVALLPEESRVRELSELDRLTRWATHGRYPGLEEPSAAEAAEALRLAQEVVRLARDELSAGGPR